MCIRDSLSSVDADLEQIQNRLARLSDCERQYQAALSEKIKSIKVSAHPAACLLYTSRPYLFNGGLPPGGSDGSGTPGIDYQIPAEALTDEEFAAIYKEAQKYVGTVSYTHLDVYKRQQRGRCQQGSGQVCRSDQRSVR